ncbi:MAG: hypothetical protein O2966_06130 [Proteobacteria bacterium]|nr:hypothetical protein [Pseudomonadota bacterium]
MQNTSSSNQQLLSGFSVQDNELIEHALAIMAKIPEPTPYQRPKGTDVAAILMDFRVNVETILAAILSDPRLEELKPKPDIASNLAKPWLYWLKILTG